MKKQQQYNPFTNLVLDDEEKLLEKALEENKRIWVENIEGFVQGKPQNLVS